MRRKLQKLVNSLFLSVLCFMMVAPVVQAEEMPAIKLKAKITQEGTLPNPAQEYVIKLKAEDISNPMPEGSENGIYTLKITGADSKEFPEIRFLKVGIYKYSIYQEEGKHNRCTYDKSVYSVTVYVTNSENGDGLETTTVLYKDHEANKLDEALFHNKYTVIKKEEPEEVVPPVAQEPTISGGISTADNSEVGMYLALLVGSFGIFAVLSRKKVK